MRDNPTVSEIFGESIADRIQHAKERQWKINDALTTEFTKQEKNPPEGKSKTKRTRFRLGNVSRYIIRIAQSEYNLNGDTETVKKLLRTGLHEIYLEWEEEIERITEINEAITQSSGYIKEDVTLPFSEQKWNLHMESNTKTKRHYILWYQEIVSDKLASKLNIPKSIVLQLAIILAGRQLSGIDDIPFEKSSKIEDIVEGVESQLERRISNLEQLAFGTMVTAWESEGSQELHDKLQDECSNILESFSKRIDRLSLELEELTE